MLKFATYRLTQRRLPTRKASSEFLRLGQEKCAIDSHVSYPSLWKSTLVQLKAFQFLPTRFELHLASSRLQLTQPQELPRRLHDRFGIVVRVRQPLDRGDFLRRHFDGD